MIVDRNSYYLSAFRLACGGTSAGRRFVVTSAADSTGTAEIPSTLEELRNVGLEQADFVLLFDVLQKLDEASLEHTLEALSATGCKLLVVAPLRYSERLLEDGSNENKLVEPGGWWAERLRRHFPTVEPVKTPDDNDAVFANWAVGPAAKAAIDALSRPKRIAKALNRLRNAATVMRRTVTHDVYSKADMLDALAGKSVSVVGNARSLAAKQFGPRIDANDIVLRFNLAPIVSLGSHGSRTDWVATSVPLEPDFIGRRGVKRVLWMSPQRRKMTECMLAVENLYIHPKADVGLLARRAGVERPSTGLMTIDFLAQSACRSIELYGFDFYKSQSFSGHQTVDTTPHAFDREEAFVSGIVAKNPRFKICG